MYWLLELLLFGVVNILSEFIHFGYVFDAFLCFFSLISTSPSSINNIIIFSSEWCQFISLFTGHHPPLWHCANEINCYYYFNHWLQCMAFVMWKCENVRLCECHKFHIKPLIFGYSIICISYEN